MRVALQNLLYLQCRSTSIHSKVLGMSILENGVLSDGPDDPEQWPYKTVLDAIKDGWWVVQFPAIDSATLNGKQCYVPCEFILEKKGETIS